MSRFSLPGRKSVATNDGAPNTARDTPRKRRHGSARERGGAARLRSISLPSWIPGRGGRERGTGTKGISEGRYLVAGAALLAVMATIATIGFRSILSSWDFLLPATVGAVVAAAIGLLAARWRLLLGESVAMSALAFFALGGLATRGIPTITAYKDFLNGIVDGWADLLSSAPPADLTPPFRAVPYTVAWVAAGTGVEILRHTKRPGVPAFGPFLAFGLSLLFIVERHNIAVSQGAAMSACVFVLVQLGQRAIATTQHVGQLNEFERPTVRIARQRFAIAGLLLVVAVGAAPFVGPHLPFAQAMDRFDLRQYQEPPFNPLNLGSPLADVKSFLVDAANQENNKLMFTVSGGPETPRWPMAVMTAYNGVVWTVADAEKAESAFVPVDSQLPETERIEPTDSTSVTFEVRLDGLDGVFLPTPGPINRRLTFDSGDEDVRMNLETGTLALPNGLRSGLTYEIESVVPPMPTDEALLQSQIPAAPLSSAEAELYPQDLRNEASDIVQGQQHEWGEVMQIRNTLIGRGGYDISPSTRPGEAIARIEDFLLGSDVPIGFEEQFAATAGVLARIDGLRARVVVGFIIPDSRWENASAQVFSSDISAWIEVDTGPVTGWVPVDVTPMTEIAPEQEPQTVEENPIAVPNPPAPPPRPPATRANEGIDAGDDGLRLRYLIPGQEGISATTIVAVSLGAGPIVLFATFCAVVVALKWRRRRRRQSTSDTNGRVAGAWAEVVDRARDAGSVSVPRATTQERIATYLTNDPRLAGAEGDLWRLGREVDRSTFSARPASPEGAALAWESSRRVIDEMRRHRSGWERFRMKVNPRSLMRDPVQTGTE